MLNVKNRLSSYKSNLLTNTNKIILLSVCGDGWFNLCKLIAQFTTGVQPYPKSQISLTRQVRPSSSHTPESPVSVYVKEI